MNFSTRKKFPKKIISDDLGTLYPHNLQLYKVPPCNEITLTEFEDLAFDRLQLLRILEQATQKGHKIYTNSWFEVIISDMRKHKLLLYLHLLGYGSGIDTYVARRADHISHFILRLAYCRSEDLRRWYLTREQEWFKARFIKLRNRSNAILKFLELNNLTYKSISSEEKEDILSSLIDCTVGGNSDLDFYKVPFTEVCSLVKSRRVYVNSGFAYIPETELITSILFIFRSLLSEALAITNRKIPLLDDDRLNNLLSNLHNAYIGNDYSQPLDKNEINIENLDYYSKKHYPLCMRNIHEVFRSTHQMKHGCRMQYGLFIKGIGVDFDSAMRFWREEFTKLIDQSQFEKQYSYFIKHQFGKVGSMTNYSPHSCIKIITSSVGSGEHHGCPFRHFDKVNLSQKLSEYGIHEEGVQEITELVKNSHYQIACSKYFELTHGQPSKLVINHPNQYFEESHSLINDGVKGPVAKKPKPLIE